MITIDRKQDQRYFLPRDEEIFNELSKIVLDFVSEKGEDPKCIHLGKREFHSLRKDCTENHLNFMGIPVGKIDEYSYIEAI